MQSRRSKPFFAGAGFTYIELLAVLIVLGILATLALPSYQDSVRRAKRAEAWTVMMKNMQQQERHFSVHGSYAGFSADDAQGFAWHSGGTPKTSAYEISAVACSGFTLKQCVLLTATPGTARVQSGYADLQCGTLTLNSAGMRTVSGSGVSCW